jgi:hypothetical protein
MGTGDIMRDITMEEYLYKWDPIFDSVCVLDLDHPAGYRYSDPTWRMIPLPRGIGTPYGPKNWRKFNCLPSRKREEINRDLGVTEVIAVSGHAIGQTAETILESYAGPEDPERCCASGCTPDVSELIKAARADLGPYHMFGSMMSKEANWTLDYSSREFSFLGARPDIMDVFLSHWGGEEAVYKMFCNYDLGGEFYYHIANGYIDPDFEKQRQLIYQCAEWKAPSYNIRRWRKFALGDSMSGVTLNGTKPMATQALNTIPQHGTGKKQNNSGSNTALKKKTPTDNGRGQETAQQGNEEAREKL